MTKKQRLFLYIMRCICFFAFGVCLGRFIVCNYFISSIAGIIIGVGMFLYVIGSEISINKLKEKCDTYKDIINELSKDRK